MKEAFRLLSKSIIRVETPDINFDEPDLLTDGVATDTVTGESKLFVGASLLFAIGVTFIGP